MKIAVIFAGTQSAAWSVSDGLLSTLKRMGHKVAPCPRGREGQPRLSAEALNMADLIIVSGPEHVFANDALTVLNSEELTEESWKREVKPPKLFLYHESATREDQNFQFHKLLSWADHHFFPAIQDAEMYDQASFALGRSHWLPFGVDTDVFRPSKCVKCNGIGKVAPAPKEGQLASSVLALPNYVAKFGDPCTTCGGSGFAKNVHRIPMGFIGMLYGKRKAFISQLRHHLSSVPLRVGQNVGVNDIDGVAWRDSALRLAQNYRECAMFLNFPHLSKLLVTKIYEVMACGTFLLTPILPSEAERNMDQFRSGTHLVYYSPTNVPFLNQTCGEFFEREEQREQIATAGMMEVHRRHRLDQRLEVMLSKVKVKEQKPTVVELPATSAHNTELEAPPASPASVPALPEIENDGGQRGH